MEIKSHDCYPDVTGESLSDETGGQNISGAAGPLLKSVVIFKFLYICIKTYVYVCIYIYIHIQAYMYICVCVHAPCSPKKLNYFQ